jgi:hypothetical protein
MAKKKLTSKKAKNGIEGTMGGLTDIGFNYNGAWGGTMAMGGGIPGAVGFTYARVAGAAPDNGPYAKKTKASAQDGTYVKKPRTDMLTMDEYRLQQALANQPQIAPSSKPINIEERNRKNKAYAQQTGKKYNERTGAVEPLVSPNTERTMNRVLENMIVPALTVGDVMGGVAIGTTLLKGVGKAALKKLPTIAREAMPSPQGGMMSAQPIRPSSTIFGMTPEQLAEFNASERLPGVDPTTRIGSLREFERAVEDWGSRNNISGGDLPSRYIERFQDIGSRYNINLSNFDLEKKIRSLTPIDKSRFLTDIYREFPNRTTLSEITRERAGRSGGSEILPESYGRATASSQSIGARNISGLTKEEVLKMAPSKDKEVISKMTEDEFRKTVTKPTGEVVPYYQGDLMPQFTGKQNVEAISPNQYTDLFNANVNRLNEIIAGRNKSGVEYRVKELSPSGQLIFETPEQIVSNRTIPQGESSWSVGINPGKWEGEVEDIASSMYYRSIPGLDMRNTGASVFSDRTPRRGTGAYESINEYLKELGLGRVKPGFNSQTQYSRGLWEDAVKKGKAFGFYNDPRVVYGSMRSLLPYAGLGALGAGAIEQKRDGGEMKYYQEGLDFKPKTISQDGSIVTSYGQWEYPGEITTIPSNEITMQGVPYPVLGISDIGDTQMMYPGEDYTFDGESVTEYPMAKGGISVNEADAQPIKKLDQLLNFTNYNDMAKAKKGKKLSKADLGQSLTNLDSTLGSMGGIGGATTQLLGGVQALIEEGKQRKKSQQALAISDVAAQAATSRPVGIERKYVRPEDMLVDPGEIASPYGTGYDFLQMENGGFIGGNPTEIQNMYNPGDLYSDLGYEPLNDSSRVKQFKQGGKAFYGMETTGTTTTASPLNASSFGSLGQTLGSFAGGGGGQQSGAGQVGSAVGGIAGSILLPGIGGPIGSAVGGLIGGAVGARGQKTMQQRQARTQANLGSAAFQQSLQGQFSGFMEDGGELKYLSHDWQPQVITKFGEYDVKDLLKAPKDADMLRAGGHLKSYTAPSERAMSTERPDFQMGGELQTHWGGYAEPISENPYLPDGGETVMFRGQSHEESDGKGRTGIGVTYGDNPVEVERGEPAVKLKDGGTGQYSMNVYGNMISPDYVLSELTHPKFENKLKGMKFKNIANKYSKQEVKDNKTIEKSINLANSVDGNDKFSSLALSTANAMKTGANMSLKLSAYDKQMLAHGQSAILDTAEERGLENDALAKGKIKPMKNSDMAKFGAKMETAQNGIVQYLTSQKQDASFAARKKLAQTAGIKNYTGTEDQNKKLLEYVKKPLGDVKAFMPTAAQIAADDAAFRAANPQTPLQYTQATAAGLAPRYSDEGLPVLTAEQIAEANKRLNQKKEKEESFNLMDFANQLNPYIRPLIQNPLDPSQLTPEMMALATNVVEPVQAQQYMPMLEQTPTVSFQDQLNEIQAEANAARRMAGNNPAAQSAIAAQAANAKNKVLGEQMRTNQMLQLESRRRNLATLNDATLKNLGILDQQFMRQSQAKSATKAQAQMALSSIADKIGRNKAETLQANVMSNMYPQYTFGPKGRIFNTGITTFNTPQVFSDYDSAELQKIVDAKKVEESKKKTGNARNGSIVKAIKNL